MAIEKTRKLNWLIIAVVLWGVGGLLCVLPTIFMSAFLFDAPGSTENSLLWLFFWSLLSFPIICIVSSLGILILRKKFKRLAFYISMLPLLSLLLVIVIFIGLNLFNPGGAGM